MPVITPVCKMIFPSFTRTSPCPAKSVIFQPARLLPSKRLVHEAAAAAAAEAALVEEGIVAGLVGGCLSAAGAEPPSPAETSTQAVSHLEVPAAHLGSVLGGNFMDRNHAPGSSGGQSQIDFLHISA